MANDDDEKPLTDTSRLKKLKSDLHGNGLDVFHPFQPKWYNDSIARDNLTSKLARLPESGQGYLIGNTKYLWPRFKNWYKRQSASCLENPLDTYCHECIQRRLNKNNFAPNSVSIYWSEETEPNQLVSMQRVAMESGFAYHDSTTQLTIHPLYGPWISYRAVVILRDQTVIPTLPPTRITCLLTPQEETCAKEAMKHALEVSDRSNLCRQLHGGSKDQDMFLKICKAWIAVRDCIEAGKAKYRFDEDQLMYHYTKNVKHLKDGNYI